MAITPAIIIGAVTSIGFGIQSWTPSLVALVYLFWGVKANAGDNEGAANIDSTPAQPPLA